MSDQSHCDYYTEHMLTEQVFAAKAANPTLAALHNDLEKRYGELLSNLLPAASKPSDDI
jgi:hypothetical protein